MAKLPPLTLRTIRDESGAHTTAYALVDEERRLVASFPVSPRLKNDWKAQRSRAVGCARLINDIEGRERDDDFRQRREEVAKRNAAPESSIIDPRTGMPFRG